MFYGRQYRRDIARGVPADKVTDSRSGFRGIQAKAGGTGKSWMRGSQPDE
jgi:hypothetical protein